MRRLRRLRLEPAHDPWSRIREGVDTADAGPRDVAGHEVVPLAVELGVDRALEDQVGLLYGWSCRPASPRGSYCTMNIVRSCAPRSASTIIFTVMPL